MAGMLLTFGKFKFLNLVDLDWEKEMDPHRQRSPV